MKKTCFLIFILSFISISLLYGEDKTEKLVRESNSIFRKVNNTLIKLDNKTITVKLKKGKVLCNSVKAIRSNQLGYVDVEVPNDVDIEEYVAYLNSTGDYELVKYNEIAEIGVSSNDSWLGNQWYLGAIGMYAAWNITTGSPDVSVAVIDNGFDWLHEDLGYGYDSYRNIDPTLGYNYYLNSTSMTKNDHGTQVSGIVSAKTNNSRGIAGVGGGYDNYGINILPFCVTNGTQTGINMGYVDDAICLAVDNGAKVINMSFGTTDTILSHFIDIIDAIDYAYNHGVTLVSITHNYGNPYITFPACYSKVIAVGAMNQDYQKCSFSNYGDGIDLVAPGKMIYSTKKDDDYDYGDGTSFAAPQVAGVVALMLSENPYLTPSTIKDVLTGTATKIRTDIYSYDSNGWNQYVGYGLVNAYDAVRAIHPNIEGSNVLYTNQTYSLDYLLSGSTVNWSLAGNSASNYTLHANTPSTNQCTITKNSGTSFADTTNLVLSAQIMYNGTVLNTVTKTLVKFYISGPSDPCGSTVYSIAHLPADYSVDWCILPAVNIFFNSILTTNSPQQNQCTIYNDGMSDWATNLYATIKNNVGDTITTFYKTIRSTFDLTFSQDGIGGYGTILPSPMASNGTIIVNHKCWVDLSSPYFDGMTIWHTGASPRNFDTFNGHISFRFSTVTSNQSMTIHGTDGCKVMHLLVIVSPDPLIPIPMLEVNPIPGGYEILLAYENDEEATSSLIDKEWTLNVVNASSSEKEISRQVKGQRTTISTANWKQGVYVLQGIVDGQECTKKIVVK